jgi:hypothetical protein
MPLWRAETARRKTMTHYDNERLQGRKWNPRDEIGRTNPIDRKNRGAVYGKSAKGWDYKRPKEEWSSAAEALARAIDAEIEAATQAEWDRRLKYLAEDFVR